MATQVFSVPPYAYVVIDNASSPTFPTLSAGSHIGYDTQSAVPDIGTALSQGTNSVTGGNGTIPDAVKNATSIATGLVLVNLKYKNPA